MVGFENIKVRKDAGVPAVWNWVYYIANRGPVITKAIASLLKLTLEIQNKRIDSQKAKKNWTHKLCTKDRKFQDFKMFCNQSDKQCDPFWIRLIDVMI